MTNPRQIRSCCGSFLGSIDTSGRRGFSIVPRRNTQYGDVFFLEFRAIAEEDEGILDSGSVRVTIGVQHAIRFCPWCGANLKSFYEKIFDALPFIIDKDDGTVWGQSQ